MNKCFRGTKPGLVFLCVTAFIITGCGLFKNIAKLPNNYKLEERGSAILLISPTNAVLCEDNITDFMVEGAMVYGWIDLDPHQYFFLDTKSGQFERFVHRREFDQFIERKSLPIFSMRFSYTFWDLTSGQRKLGDQEWLRHR